MCMWVTYIFMCVTNRLCMHIYMCVYTTSLCICIFAFSAHIYAHRYAHRYVNTHTHTHTHTYIHTYIHDQNDSYTYIHTYIHTYTRIHIHAGPRRKLYKKSKSVKVYLFTRMHLRMCVFLCMCLCMMNQVHSWVFSVFKRDICVNTHRIIIIIHLMMYPYMRVCMG